MPPDTVFAYLADPLTAPVIDPAIVRYEPEGGRMGLGVRNAITMRMFGLRVHSTSETTGWEPPRRMAFRSVEPRHPIVVEARHEMISDVATGGTLYTWALTIIPTSTFGRLVAPTATRFFGRNARAQQARLLAVFS